MEHDALLLGQIARDLLHALLHRHNNTWTAFFEPVVGTGGNESEFNVDKKNVFIGLFLMFFHDQCEPWV